MTEDQWKAYDMRPCVQRLIQVQITEVRTFFHTNFQLSRNPAIGVPDFSIRVVFFLRAAFFDKQWQKDNPLLIRHILPVPVF